MSSKIKLMRQLLLLVCLGSFCIASAVKQDCTDLARDEETLLVFSTLGGGLTAIDPISSEIRWTMDDEPAVKSKAEPNFQFPQYLPDPRDGSIYQLGNMGDLKRLPYTIPQLVASAPCRSSDGILYSGKKSDSWFLIDPKTGRREKVMGFMPSNNEDTETNFSGSDKIGWATSRSIYLGRTQYTVMMFDSLSKEKNTKPWNITFYDYASHTMAPEISTDYEYIHLTASSSGLISTLNRQGKFIWQKDLSSPVVSVFLLGKEGLLSVPFTTVADDALRNIIEEAKEGVTNEIKLFKSLYIGEHSHGLYALPSLIDKNTARLSSEPPVKLLEGPHKTNSQIKPDSIYIKNLLNQNNYIVLGHYDVPKDENNLQFKISPSTMRGMDNKQLSTIGNSGIIKQGQDFIIVDGVKNPESNLKEIGIQTEDEITLINNDNLTKKFNSTLLDKHRITKFLNDSKSWLTDEQNGAIHQILIILILLMITMFWYTCSTLREIRTQSQSGSQTSGSKKNSGSSNINYEDLVDLGDGEIQVGKITFNCSEVLGKGCEGTFVFKGTFEKRNVAVKRLLPECFTFADREVALLRESDAHENVVRYFCTEQDRQFRYIAVELCTATLQDYTEGERAKELRSKINRWEVLKQATAGLSHLHSLQIVHRDIKPQNVLLSLPDTNNTVRAMISDFGLCKKLNYGRASFSRRSGITGTEGWIAPEMLEGRRTTASVDIFSLGCVFYYVLSNGKHPFGDTLKRQANILSNEYDLIKIHESSIEPKSQLILAEELIADMIVHNAQKRPHANAVYNHPVFWKEERILSFLQDVSDRVEKLTLDIQPLRSLEKNGKFVVRQDWNLHLDSVITDDLQKYRGYMGASVRDLLRAFRNKKHHYHQLSNEVQEILGSIPNEFTDYWIKKFPYLLSHAYHALSICSKENHFKSYYNQNYKFSRPQYFYEEDDNEFSYLLKNPKLLPKNESPKRNFSDKMQKNYKKNFNNQKKINLVQNIYSDNVDNKSGIDNFHRNFQSIGVIEDTASVDITGDNQRDVFANFKFRNRNSKNRQLQNKDKINQVTWVLPNNEN